MAATVKHSAHTTPALLLSVSSNPHHQSPESSTTEPTAITPTAPDHGWRVFLIIVRFFFLVVGGPAAKKKATTQRATRRE
jgi:hypothetical protein